MNNPFNHLLANLVSMVKEAVNAFQAVYHRKALQKIRDLNQKVKYLYNRKAYLHISLSWMPLSGFLVTISVSEDRGDLR